MAGRRTRRVVVSGFGAVSCLGHDAASLWQGLVEGRSGLGPITRFDTSHMACRIGGQLPDSLDLEAPFADWPGRPARLTDRVSLLVVEQALQAAGLNPFPAELAERAGAILLCGSGDILEHEGWLASGTQPMPGSARRLLDTAADWVAWRHGLRGPRAGVVTACSSGLVAVARACEAIWQGEAEVMLAGGADVLSQLCFGGFQSLRAMDPEICKPFDRRRRGMNLGDGGAALVLEEREHAQARGVTDAIEILGYGLTQDGYHIATPDVSGQSWARTLRDALADSDIAPERIGYINAHATATELNDRAETAALKLAFGDVARRIPISSVKAAIGHCQFAAGVLETVITIQALQHGLLPPTRNLEQPDPECDLDHVALNARPADVEVALCNSFGFGGSSAVLVLGRDSG